MSAELGFVPVMVQGKYLQRRCYEKIVTYGFCKDHVWWGAAREGWGEEGMVGKMLRSDKGLSCKVQCVIPLGNVEALADVQRRQDEEGKKGWVAFTDGSVKDGGVGCAYVLWKGSKEEGRGSARLLKEESIMCAELCGIYLVLVGAGMRGCEELSIFTDSQAVIRVLGSMVGEGNSARIWDTMIPALNQFEAVTLCYIPGHSGVGGNVLVDGIAKRAATEVLGNLVWEVMSFDVGDGGRWREMRRRVWEQWCIEEGHGYYTCRPTAARHLQGLTRWDAMVLLRVPAGVVVAGHEDCMGGNKRFHPFRCWMLSEGRPNEDTVMVDRWVYRWKDWLERLNHLGCGILAGKKKHMGSLVMGGNPFDRTLDVLENGVIVRVDMAEKDKVDPCVKCKKTHASKSCFLPWAEVGKGEWFFVGDVAECKSYRRGGYKTRKGLLSHLQKSGGCASRWRESFWLDIRGRWNDW